MLLQLFWIVQYTPIPTPVFPSGSPPHQMVTLFHLDVFSSQTLRCCTTTWSSCSPTSYSWPRWRSVHWWRPSSSSATSSRTTSGRRLSWRSSWPPLLACGSPQRCRGTGAVPSFELDVLQRWWEAQQGVYQKRGWGGAWWHLGSGQSLASELCHPEIADSSLSAVCWTLLGRSCLTLPRMLKAFAENEKWKIFAQFLQKLGSWAVSAALDSWACTRVFPNNAVYVRFKHLGFLWPKRTEDAWRTSRTQLFGFFSFSQVQCGVLANLSSLFCIFKMFIGQCKALLKVPWYK